MGKELKVTPLSNEISAIIVFLLATLTVTNIEALGVNGMFAAIVISLLPAVVSILVIWIV